MKLVVCLEGRVAGTLEGDGLRASFVYSGEWLSAPGAYPLSQSLPLQPLAYVGRAVLNFLWGLLPDNDRALNTWSKWFHVSARNPIALLSHVGEDCAGAVQFVTEERLGEVLESSAGPQRIEWLGEQELERRIRGLAQGGTGGRTAEEGQFSLAGAQPKTALFYDARTRRWGIPGGRTPTTHILKPVTGEFDGFAENEHFCLALARRIGLPAARSAWQTIGEVPTLIVERYDRVRIEGRWRRVHQEDCCQALGVNPASKYESDGGPGFPQVMNLLNSADEPQTDRHRLMRTACLTYLLAATDMHAKNFSLLHARGNDRPSIRLAPLYDIASAWPYTSRPAAQKLKLAMRVGGHYRIREIQPRHFQKMAIACNCSAEVVIAELKDLAERLPDEAAAVAAEVTVHGMLRPVLSRLTDGLALQCRNVGRQIATAGG